MANRLASETSPYLLQHSDNPVDWWPWGEAALAEAQHSGRPILLSIGYAACHWCHVMAHESFENDDIAKLMNTLFVNIKVDREERPDIDHIYMSALHHMGEQGGWPLTMFLTPAGEPFWGGTYFPPAARYGRPGFPDVLREVARVYHEEPDKITQSRDALMARLRERRIATQGGTLAAAELDRVAASVLEATDKVHGGLSGAPKFPQAPMLEYLWRAGMRTKDRRFFDGVDLALTHMSQGGIYDHLGGGYARYSVDARWLVPHFEKMLYDNAQILDLLALAHARAANPLYAARARETAEWLVRDMRVGQGAFAASFDADSEGHEGKFYVWTLGEIEAVLGVENAAKFAAQYDVSAPGNFEGNNILNRLNTLDFDPADDAAYAALHQMLRKARSNRVPPARDDKVLADWNGLAIAALVHAAIVFDAPDWLHVAREAFDFVRNSMSEGDRLGHSFRDGRLTRPGLASDHAAMIQAALALHEAVPVHQASDAADFLGQAVRWQEALEHWYGEPATGRYFLTASDADDLVVRPDTTSDDAVPNHHGIIAQNLLRLAVATGDARWRTRADRLFEAVIPLAAQNAFAHLSLLNALDLRDSGMEILITGDDVNADALARIALSLPHAIRIVHRVAPGAALAPNHPAHAALEATRGSAAFVCTGQSCRPPVTTPDELRAMIAHLSAS